MLSPNPVPLVRCRLDGPQEVGDGALRYIPLGEFELWRHLMETRHQRHVAVESVSHWIVEDAARWNSGYSADDLQPVIRVHLEIPGPSGVPIPVERFFPAETYPQAQEALLSHFGTRPRGLLAVPGYFVPEHKPDTVSAA